jgi:hypothetical protein
MRSMFARHDSIFAVGGLDPVRFIRSTKHAKVGQAFGRRGLRRLQRSEESKCAHDGHSEHQDGQICCYALLRSLGHG